MSTDTRFSKVFHNQLKATVTGAICVCPRSYVSQDMDTVPVVRVKEEVNNKVFVSVEWVQTLDEAAPAHSILTALDPLPQRLKKLTKHGGVITESSIRYNTDHEFHRCEYTTTFMFTIADEKEFSALLSALLAEELE